MSSGHNTCLISQPCHSSLSFTPLPITLSLTFLTTQSKKMLKSHGDIIHPCFNLILTSKYSPTLLSSVTHALLPLYKSLILLIKYSSTQHSCNTLHSSSLQTLSYTFTRSMNVIRSSLLFSLYFSTNCFNTNI